LNKKIRIQFIEINLISPQRRKLRLGEYPMQPERQESFELLKTMLSSAEAVHRVSLLPQSHLDEFKSALKITNYSPEAFTVEKGNFEAVKQEIEAMSTESSMRFLLLRVVSSITMEQLQHLTQLAQDGLFMRLVFIESESITDSFLGSDDLRKKVVMPLSLEERLFSPEELSMSGSSREATLYKTHDPLGALMQEMQKRVMEGMRDFSANSSVGFGKFNRGDQPLKASPGGLFGNVNESACISAKVVMSDLLTGIRNPNVRKRRLTRPRRRALQRFIRYEREIQRQEASNKSKKPSLSQNASGAATISMNASPKTRRKRPREDETFSKGNDEDQTFSKGIDRSTVERVETELESELVDERNPKRAKQSAEGGEAGGEGIVETGLNSDNKSLQINGSGSALTKSCEDRASNLAEESDKMCNSSNNNEAYNCGAESTRKFDSKRSGGFGGGVGKDLGEFEGFPQNCSILKNKISDMIRNYITN
jgi:hypothetical protein